MKPSLLYLLICFFLFAQNKIQTEIGFGIETQGGFNDDNHFLGAGLSVTNYKENFSHTLRFSYVDEFTIFEKSQERIVSLAYVIGKYYRSRWFTLSISGGISLNHGYRKGRLLYREASQSWFFLGNGIYEQRPVGIIGGIGIVKVALRVFPPYLHVGAELGYHYAHRVNVPIVRVNIGFDLTE